MKHFVYLLTVALFVISASVIAQIERAPTVAQCQADQRLWLSRLDDEDGSLPPYKTMMRWALEMRDCQTIDPDNDPRYYNTYNEICTDQLLRVTAFLERHKLYDQFIKEDAEQK